MNKLLNISEASGVLGVTPKTIRLWEKEGKITSIKTRGGHRRFDLNDVVSKNKKLDDKTIVYARVSTTEQKKDLERQVKVLEIYCAQHGWVFETIQDIGSGINYNKKGLTRLLKMICLGEVDRLVVTHKDRLLRLGSDLIFSICEQFNTEIIIINKDVNESFEEELTKDVLEIITVFSAKLYGKRSHKNKQLIKNLNIIKEDIKQ